MASIIQSKLNLVPGAAPGGILPRVRVSQGDAEDRILQFELFDGTTAADMTDVVDCYIGGTKPDGNGFTVSCTLASNVATAVLTDQATVLAGLIRCKLYLLSATGSVRSASFDFDVDPDPLADAGTSDTDITAIVQAAAMYANNAAESAEAAATSAEGAATAGATAGQAAAEAVVANKADLKDIAADWAENESYAVDDFTNWNGNVYKCILAHISSEVLTPANTTYWENTSIGEELKKFSNEVRNETYTYNAYWYYALKMKGTNLLTYIPAPQGATSYQINLTTVEVYDDSSSWKTLTIQNHAMVYNQVGITFTNDPNITLTEKSAYLIRLTGTIKFS